MSLKNVKVLRKNANANISRFLASFIWKHNKKCTMLMMTIVTNDRLRCNVRKVWPLKQSKNCAICF